jgi:hypothetical protein
MRVKRILALLLTFVAGAAVSTTVLTLFPAREAERPAEATRPTLTFAERVPEWEREDYEVRRDTALRIAYVINTIDGDTAHVFAWTRAAFEAYERNEAAAVNRRAADRKTSGGPRRTRSFSDFLPRVRYDPTAAP